MRKVLAGVMVGAGMLAFMRPAFAADQLTWQECLHEASLRHPDLIAAREAVVQSKDIRSAALGGFWPQVMASGSSSKDQNTQTGSSKSFSAGVSGSLLLFDAFKTVDTVRAATEDLNASKQDFQFTSADVRYRLRAAFINMLHAQQAVDLALEIQKLRKSDLDLISLRYSSGTEHRGALLNAKANFAQAGVEVDQARRDLVAAQRQLMKEMGLGGSGDFAVTDDLTIDPRELVQPDLQALGDQNPAYLKAVAQEHSAQDSLGAAGAERWPVVSLTSDITRFDTQWVPTQRDATAGIKVSLPLFEGGSISARIDQAKSVYRQRQQQTRSTRDAVVLTLEQNWNKLKAAYEDVGVQQEFLDSAMERSRISEQQYAIGLVTFDDWTIIEDALVAAKKSLLEARTNAFLAEAAWVQAKGGTLEYGDQ